jgi:hypothetical protein
VPRKKADRKVALSERALADLDTWMKAAPDGRAAEAARYGRQDTRVPI